MPSLSWGFLSVGGETAMESSDSPFDDRPIPSTEPKGKPWTRILAVLILVLLIAVVAWQLLQPPGEIPLRIRSVTLGGTQGSIRHVNTQLSFSAQVEGPGSGYRWEFGDGGNATTAANSTTYTYQGKGVYLVLLTVTSPAGQIATNDATGLLQVTIVNPAQTLSNESAVAVAYANATLGPVNADVGFDGSGSYGFDFNATNFGEERQPFYEPNASKISDWSWNFGDGSEVVQGGLEAAKSSHTFGTAELFAVKLIVTTGVGGLTDSAFLSVRIRPVAMASSVLRNPDAMVIGTLSDPQSLDPAVASDPSGREVIKNIYERLVTREIIAADPARPILRNDNIVGDLAESWTPSPDGLTWNFTIREGVHFHDGSTLTAYDVEYSLQRVLTINGGPAWILDQSLTGYATDNPSTRQNERWDAINASVVATSGRYVEFRLAVPYGAFLSTMDLEVASILPQAWIEAHGGTAWGQSNAYVSRNARGTGPYKLDHWTPRVDLQLVRNADYWGTPKPRLTNILYKVVLDAFARAQLLKDGNIDWAESIPPEYVAQVKSSAEVEVKENPSLVLEYMGMNLNNSWAGDLTRVNNTSPFRDVHVRRAVSYAIDYAFIEDTVLRGSGYQMRSPIPEGMPFHNGSYWHYGDASLSTRLAQAQAEMALAEPSLRTGFDTELAYGAGSSIRDDIATLVRQNLAPLNITVNPTELSWPEFLRRLAYREAPLFLLERAPHYLDPDDYIFPMFHSSRCPRWIPGTGDPGESTWQTASSCYWDHDVDTWIQDAAVNRSRAVRGARYEWIQQRITEDAVWVYLYQPMVSDSIRTWLEGYYFDPMELKDFQYLYKDV